MSGTNQTEANLLAGQDRLEKDFADLGTAVSKEIKDATDEIKALLAKTVVNPATVTAVTDRMGTLATNIEALIPMVAAADPGDQTPPPAPEPTPTPDPTPAPPEGGSTVDNPPTQ